MQFSRRFAVTAPKGGGAHAQQEENEERCDRRPSHGPLTGEVVLQCSPLPAVGSSRFPPLIPVPCLRSQAASAEACAALYPQFFGSV